MTNNLEKSLNSSGFRKRRLELFPDFFKGAINHEHS